MKLKEKNRVRILMVINDEPIHAAGEWIAEEVTIDQIGLLEDILQDWEDKLEKHD